MILERTFPTTPTRSELRELTSHIADLATTAIATPAPTLEELTSRPDAPHQGAPQPPATRLHHPVRLVITGTDAALAAVATALMRQDQLWVDLAYIPTDPASSPIALAWGLADLSPTDLADAAIAAPTTPTALVRDDTATVTLGLATLTAQDPATPLVGEVIVDSHTLYRRFPGATSGHHTPTEIRIVPTLGAPGIAAVARSEERRWFRRRPIVTEPREGRAVQAGGDAMLLTRDGVAHPRPLSAVTFYRHLRDLQVVRFTPAARG